MTPVGVVLLADEVVTPEFPLEVLVLFGVGQAVGLSIDGVSGGFAYHLFDHLGHLPLVVNDISLQSEFLKLLEEDVTRLVVGLTNLLEHLIFESGIGIEEEAVMNHFFEVSIKGVPPDLHFPFKSTGAKDYSMGGAKSSDVDRFSLEGGGSRTILGFNLFQGLTWAAGMTKAAGGSGGIGAPGPRGSDRRFGSAGSGGWMGPLSGLACPPWSPPGSAPPACRPPIGVSWRSVRIKQHGFHKIYIIPPGFHKEPGGIFKEGTNEMDRGGSGGSSSRDSVGNAPVGGGWAGLLGVGLGVDPKVIGDRRGFSVWGVGWPVRLEGSVASVDDVVDTLSKLIWAWGSSPMRELGVLPQAWNSIPCRVMWSAVAGEGECGWYEGDRSRDEWVVHGVEAVSSLLLVPWLETLSSRTTSGTCETLLRVTVVGPASEDRRGEGVPVTWDIGVYVGGRKVVIRMGVEGTVWVLVVCEDVGTGCVAEKGWGWETGCDEDGGDAKNGGSQCSKGTGREIGGDLHSV
ncbi:hypothetical protein ARMSODRAFT_983462 [Armillaria solidipes]|uniref:Uncharacterized protein n=1 Tax=Armillaria solidipes TaxID=1076256 RepID=A0A2H3AVK3_9AGAR|nr:hypothetical protein ARMSODRAFT_983462 [Armillaria solidipes]